MKKNIIITLLAAATLTSCGEYNKLLKSTDYEYKYEAAKNYFAKGQYNRSATLLNELITILKGTDKAEESLYTPEPRLDQSSTYQAIQQLQMFMEYFPNSVKKQEAQDMIFALQDKLVLKELYSAKLYYNLGNYMGNNYEELSILILRARYEMAIYSVEDKKADRYRETVDEYYAFKNEFPESKYLKEAEKIFNESQKVIKD